jgi:hypothetical protein
MAKLLVACVLVCACMTGKHVMYIIYSAKVPVIGPWGRSRAAAQRAHHPLPPQSCPRSKTRAHIPVPIHVPRTHNCIHTGSAQAKANSIWDAITADPRLKALSNFITGDIKGALQNPKLAAYTLFAPTDNGGCLTTLVFSAAATSAHQAAAAKRHVPPP